MIGDSILDTIDRAIQDTDVNNEPAKFRPTQTSHKTYVTCDVQTLVGSSWRSVFIVREKDTTDPDSAAREWLAGNREQDATYRVVRTIKMVAITVDPA
jgi:hypothetical protein